MEWGKHSKNVEVFAGGIGGALRPKVGRCETRAAVVELLDCEQAEDSGVCACAAAPRAECDGAGDAGGIAGGPRLELHHVDARVSDDLEDVGSFRPQKFIRLFKCILQAWWIRLHYGGMAFYYVPAPAKRSAIMRDWVVMALCRPWFPELILHWHAYGLGEWVAARNDWQRRLTRWALGKADLSIVLNNYNRRDAAVFEPKRIEVVPNGIADQFPDYETVLAPRRKARADRLRHLGLRRDKEDLEIVRFLFLGHLIESKGVFVAIEATGLANEELRRAGAAWRAHLTLAGSFASGDEKRRVMAAIDKVNGIGHGLKKMGEDRSTRLADARTGGDENFEIGDGRLEMGGPGAMGDGRLEIGDGGADLADGGAEGGDRRWEMEKGACVELAGFLGPEQKKSALEEADCLVFPTFYEGETQGLVLLEALSAGLPVITTSWRGVAEALLARGPHAAAIRSPREVSNLMLEVVNFAEFAVYREVFLARFEVSRFITNMAKVFRVATSE